MNQNIESNEFQISDENKNTVSYRSSMTVHVMRLQPDTDLYQEILSFLKNSKIQAATIISCVGSLKKINIRTATGKNFLKIEDNFEIVSLVGCVSIDRCHVHISLGDKDGRTLSGHLLDEGNIVFTTAELVLGELNELKFGQAFCDKSGWPELTVQYRE